MFKMCRRHRLVIFFKKASKRIEIRRTLVCTSSYWQWGSKQQVLKCSKDVVEDNVITFYLDYSYLLAKIDTSGDCPFWENLVFPKIGHGHRPCA